METERKIQILADAAKYDVSCSSSGSRRQNTGGTGNACFAGICHSWADDGRCISLLKILQSNVCAYNCLYCVNRKDSDIPRASFTPRELAELTINFYKRNYIEGLFLSSGVCGNADNAMERMVETASILRQEMNFCGYIHMKAIPGADSTLLEKAGFLADRISVNIELPSNQALALLAPDKTRENILLPMDYLENRRQEQRGSRQSSFIPAGQSTQMIVGASPENDRQIITLADSLYRRYKLKRVYYSAYIPVVKDNRLPALSAPPLWRENRLYQADWLLRFYGFQAEELLDGSEGNFSPNYDPKIQWALNHLHVFPVEINKAPYEMLLRVPGIGVRSAKRILSARRAHSLAYEDLGKIGVVVKRACHFITCSGRYAGTHSLRQDILTQVLSNHRQNTNLLSSGMSQLAFDFNDSNYLMPPGSNFNYAPNQKRDLAYDLDFGGQQAPQDAACLPLPASSPNRPVHDINDTSKKQNQSFSQLNTTAAGSYQPVFNAIANTQETRYSVLTGDL